MPRLQARGPECNEPVIPDPRVHTAEKRSGSCPETCTRAPRVSRTTEHSQGPSSPTHAIACDLCHSHPRAASLWAPPALVWFSGALGDALPPLPCSLLSRWVKFLSWEIKSLILQLKVKGFKLPRRTNPLLRRCFCQVVTDLWVWNPFLS